MTPMIILSAAALFCVTIAFGLLIVNANLKKQISTLVTEQAILNTKKESLDNSYRLLVDQTTKTQQENILLSKENTRLQERITFIEEEKERLRKESEMHFKNLANEILNKNSIEFKEQSEHRLLEMLTPLRENIEQFKKAINESYSNEARERFSLQERIKELIELNQSIGKEAKDLTRALKGNNKVQGDWGEMILESILEKSGLQKGREYMVQQTTDECGKTLRNEFGSALRPDVVVNYPGDRHIVIDSKVSLSAYVDYINASDKDEQDRYAKQHIMSIRKHINELRDKKYQDYVGKGKTDFVMMFIPNEAAYISALQIESNLWQEAYDSRVLLVSPTQLISALRLVAQLWNQDRQTRNAIEIANTGGHMYDKLAGFIEDMQKIEKSLHQAHETYKSALTKLSEGKGNLLSQAEKMRTLGAKASKQLPESLIYDK